MQKSLNEIHNKLREHGDDYESSPAKVMRRVKNIKAKQNRKHYEKTIKKGKKNVSRNSNKLSKNSTNCKKSQQKSSKSKEALNKSVIRYDKSPVKHDELLNSSRNLSNIKKKFTVKQHNDCKNSTRHSFVSNAKSTANFETSFSKDLTHINIEDHYHLGRDVSTNKRQTSFRDQSVSKNRRDRSTRNIEHQNRSNSKLEDSFVAHKRSSTPMQAINKKKQSVPEGYSEENINKLKYYKACKGLSINALKEIYSLSQPTNEIEIMMKLF